MVFNDTSNLQGLIQDCEFNCQLGSGNISGNSTLLKEFTRLLNKGLNSAVVQILDVQDEFDFDDLNYTNYPILTTDLVTGQQDYQFPTDILDIKRIEIYDNQTQDWIRVNPVDNSQLNSATDSTTINERFDISNPYYDVAYGSIFLYPIPTSAVTNANANTNNLKIWISREISKFASTDTTKEPGIVDPFHQYVSIFASYEYARTKRLGMAEQLKRDLEEIKEELRRYYNKKQKDRRIRIYPNNQLFNDMQ